MYETLPSLVGQSRCYKNLLNIQRAVITYSRQTYVTVHELHNYALKEYVFQRYSFSWRQACRHKYPSSDLVLHNGECVLVRIADATRFH